MEKEQELLKIGENYESKPDGTLVYKSPILSKDGFEVVRIEETAIANHTPMANKITFTYGGKVYVLESTVWLLQPRDRQTRRNRPS